MSQTSAKDCLQAALRILTRRDHSCRELTSKLQQRGFDRHVIESAVAQCVRLSYLDDSRFASTYTSQLRRKGFGPYHIRRMLHAKGLSESIINATVDESCKSSAIICDCRKAAEKKAARCGEEFSSERMRQRIHRFLLQRGFPSDIVRDTLDDLFRSNDIE